MFHTHSSLHKPGDAQPVRFIQTMLLLSNSFYVQRPARVLHVRPAPCVGQGLSNRCRVHTRAVRPHDEWFAVGIDLGTTTSALAIVEEGGQPYILEDELGKAVIPSLVTLMPVSGSRV